MDPTIPPASPARAHASRSAFARALATTTAAFGWLMCTLATGAVAAFIALVVGTRPDWLVLVLAVPLTVVLKLCGCLHVRWPAPVAAVAVLLAGFYAVCLTSIARVAAATGFPFGQAFSTGGIGLVLQVGKLGLTALSLLIYVAAAVLAALVATWLRRPAARR